MVSSNPFSSNKRARCLFVGGFTSIATLAAARWAFTELPRNPAPRTRGVWRRRDELAVLRIEVLGDEIAGVEVCQHLRLGRVNGRTVGLELGKESRSSPVDC